MTIAVATVLNASLDIFGNQAEKFFNENIAEQPAKWVQQILNNKNATNRSK